MIHPKKLEATNKWDIDTGCFFMHVSRLVCVHQGPEQVMCHWFTVHGWCNGWQSGEHQLVALHSCTIAQLDTTSVANGAAAQVGLRTGGTRCRGAGVLVTLADQASSFQASP